jgi:hypothetical protein
MKAFYFGLALLAVVLIAVPADADVVAYEGFNAGTSSGPLAGVAATGFGFTGVWDITNGLGGASRYELAGLSYPASYPGSHVAVGGNGRVTGATGDNAFLALDLDAAADVAVNSASDVYIAFLAEMVGTTVTEAGVLDAATRTTNNYASEYPRNQGIRLNNIGTGSNTALGTIGKGSDWNSNGVTYGDPNPLIIDTWGVANMNDVNKLYSGADFADGVDHVVLHVDTSTSTYEMWVNPTTSGQDGYLTWQHTNGPGNVVPFVLKAFGLEAGNGSSNRPVGDMVVDEIYIADTFRGAAGFGVPEPSSLVLLAVGLLGLGVLRRRC